jgi:hypothetical protein
MSSIALDYDIPYNRVYRAVHKKISLRTARDMVRAGLPVRRSELRGNSSNYVTKYKSDWKILGFDTPPTSHDWLMRINFVKKRAPGKVLMDYLIQGYKDAVWKETNGLKGKTPAQADALLAPIRGLRGNPRFDPYRHHVRVKSPYRPTKWMLAEVGGMNQRCPYTRKPISVSWQKIPGGYAPVAVAGWHGDYKRYPHEGNLIRVNQSQFQRGLNKSIPPEMKQNVSYYSLARIVEAIKNLKKRNYNDEMIESVAVKERPGNPRDFIFIVKHRYFVNGSRIYSAGLKTEETIEKFVPIIGTKMKRIGNSDYVFNIYGVRFPKAIERKPGKLFDNNKKKPIKGVATDPQVFRDFIASLKKKPFRHLRGNMKSFPNIEKSKFNEGEYVGYSPKAVNVFSIKRNYPGWRATGQIYKTTPKESIEVLRRQGYPGVTTKIIYGKDLAEISKELENL